MLVRCGSEYRPNRGDVVTVVDGSVRSTVRVMKDSRGSPIFKDDGKLRRLAYDHVAKSWTVADPLP
jgi:hypothetical protein